MISPSKKVVRVGWSAVRPGVGGQCWKGRGFREEMLAFDLQEATHGGFCHVDVFELHLDLVDLLVGLLLTAELAEGAEER